jgi:hypothetical protein
LSEKDLFEVSEAVPYMILTADEWRAPAKNNIKSNKTLLETKPRRYYTKALAKLRGHEPGSRERITKRITKSRKVPEGRRKATVTLIIKKGLKRDSK